MSGSTLNINLNKQQTPPTTQTEHQQRHMPIPPAPARVKTNVLTTQEKLYSCGRWQEFKYPCRHAVGYFRKWEDMSFPDIGLFPELCIYFAFICITFHLHFIYISHSSWNRYITITFH